MNIKIYHNPRCTKSRQTLALLEKETTDFKPIDLIRKNEEIWRDNYKRKEMTDVEIIRAMEGNPKLIERPIVINERQGIIGRPPEKVLSLFT